VHTSVCGGQQNKAAKPPLNSRATPSGLRIVSSETAQDLELHKVIYVTSRYTCSA